MFLQFGDFVVVGLLFRLSDSSNQASFHLCQVHVSIIFHHIPTVSTYFCQFSHAFPPIFTGFDLLLADSTSSDQFSTNFQRLQQFSTNFHLSYPYYIPSQRIKPVPTIFFTGLNQFQPLSTNILRFGFLPAQFEPVSIIFHITPSIATCSVQSSSFSTTLHQLRTCFNLFKLFFHYFRLVSIVCFHLA